MDYYVYLHKKKTNGTVFYVGKGKGNRAYQTHGRSKFWRGVVEKYGLVVEIYMDNLQEWYAHELEKDLIALYGRRDKGLGNLVNMTEGGDGVAGYKFTDEAKNKISIKVSGDSNPRADKKIYTFVNIHTKEIFKGTRFELESKTSLRVRDLFKKNLRSINGWTIAGRESIKGKVDETIYHFEHKSGLSFVGTRMMFKRKFDVETKSLFNTGNLSFKGWYLKSNFNKLIEKLPYEFKSVTLYHKDGKVFRGTLELFELVYGFNASPLISRTNRRGSVKGWSI